MKLESKKSDRSTIAVLSKGKKILVRKGFVTLVAGSHDGFNRVSKSAIKHYYEIPEGVTFE